MVEQAGVPSSLNRDLRFVLGVGGGGVDCQPRELMTLKVVAREGNDVRGKKRGCCMQSTREKASSSERYNFVNLKTIDLGPNYVRVTKYVTRN